MASAALEKHNKRIADLQKLLPTLKGISKKEIKKSITQEGSAIKDITAHIKDANSFLQKKKAEVEKRKAEEARKEAERKRIEAEK